MILRWVAIMGPRRVASIQTNVLAIYHNALPPNITPSSSPGTLSTSTLYDRWRSIKFPFCRPINGTITCPGSAGQTYPLSQICRLLQATSLFHKAWVSVRVGACSTFHFCRSGQACCRKLELAGGEIACERGHLVASIRLCASQKPVSMVQLHAILTTQHHPFACHVCFAPFV